MRKEVHIFLTALMFFTRIPCPKWVDHAPEYLNQSTRYFTLIGILVGGISALVYYLAGMLLPHTLAVLISMAGSIYVTGAFHEDGLADVCDGLGGGWAREDILRIMKDSRIGTFGVVGLVLVLGIKFAALYEMAPEQVPLVLIAGHSISRLMATSLIFALPYLQDDHTSKAKPAVQQMGWGSLAVASVFGIVPLFLLGNYWYLSVIVPLLLALMYLSAKFNQWIGGQTGDCAGATQQICEVVFYVSVLVVLQGVKGEIF